MYEPQPSNSTPDGRPAPVRANVTPIPIQRGNYGIPPRQNIMPPQTPTPAVAPTPLTTVTPVQPITAGVPRMVDVAAPRPKPTFTAVAPVPAPVMTTPVEQAAPGTPLAQPQPAAPTPFAQPAPLFTPSQPIKAQPRTKKSAKLAALMPKIILVTAVVGMVLAVGGIGRLVTAGSTAGDTIAVGAVTANDGDTIHVQFTADDGMLHKYTTTGKQSKLIPGSAVEIAYQPGAPDKTAKLVSTVKARHSFGVSLMATGILLLIVAGISIALQKIRQPKKPVSEQATAVAA